MLRSSKAAQEGNPDHEFNEFQVESFKRLQFLEFGWKKLGLESGSREEDKSSKEKETKNKSFCVNGDIEECDEWIAHTSSSLQNGERITFSGLLGKECDEGPLEGVSVSPVMETQCQEMSFSRTDAPPYIIDNFNLNKETPILHSFNEVGAQGEPFYYSPQFPPCSCECVLNDVVRLEGLPRVHSGKDSHLSLSIPPTSSLGISTNLKKQKQWDSASADLIVPVSEANNYSSTWTPLSTSTPTYPSSSIDVEAPHFNNQNSIQLGSSLSSQTKSPNYFCNSDHTILPETSIGSISQSSPSQGDRRTGSKRKHFFCEGFELDFRKICVICGFLIATAGVVGVLFALEMKTLQKNDSKHDLVHKLLSEVPLIDGHNDLAWNLRKFLQNQLHEVNFDTDLTQHEPFSGSAWSQTDLIRLREGCLGAQLWSAYVPCSAQHLDAVQIAVEQIDVIQRLVDKYPDSLRLVSSVKEIERSHREKRIASLIGVEGGHAIGNSLAVLRMFYNLGARYLTLTHNCNTPWAGSASNENYLPERGGLTEFGKLVILEMNRLGFLVDLAHVSFQTMKDGLAVSRAPVIFSHSAASALCNHSRNVPDEILRLVAANGGIVMVSFYNVFIACNETASMQDVIAHIEHIRQIAGVDHVGLGAGFDGINFVPVGLEDVSKYPDLISALLLKDNKWSEMDLKKLIGNNFLRVFRQVESVRDEWKRVGVRPIEEWIPRDDLEGHRVSCSYQGAP